MGSEREKETSVKVARGMKTEERPVGLQSRRYSTAQYGYRTIKWNSKYEGIIGSLLEAWVHFSTIELADQSYIVTSTTK
jgi:hypothetical protein